MNELESNRAESAGLELGSVCFRTDLGSARSWFDSNPSWALTKQNSATQRAAEFCYNPSFGYASKHLRNGFGIGDGSRMPTASNIEI